MKYLKEIVEIMCISAWCIAEPVPEVINLHPEKYTLQLTLASMPINTDPAPGLIFGAPQKGGGKSQSPIMQLLNSTGATYTEYATIYTGLNTEFSSKDGLVMGTVRLASPSAEMPGDPLVMPSAEKKKKALLAFTIQYQGKEIKMDDFPLAVNEWTGFGIGKGNDLSHFMLIKLYEPTK
jgi:hypothetical protein